METDKNFWGARSQMLWRMIVCSFFCAFKIEEKRYMEVGESKAGIKLQDSQQDYMIS